MAVPSALTEFVPAARNEFFANLKPVCVDISKLAIQPPSSSSPTANAKRLLDLVDRLYTLLHKQSQYNARVIDEKIADYVFFPISHVLRSLDSYPIRLTESAIKCLQILIQYGWKHRISKDLAQQLLILLTFVIGGVPDSKRDGKTNQLSSKRRHDEPPEETVAEGYKTLTELIKAAGQSAKDSALTDAKIIPSLGHAVLVILDGVTDGQTPEIQVQALHAINAFYTTVKQNEVLATFFPGTVSALSRTSTPPLAFKRQRRVLVGCVSTLCVVLTTVLGDVKVMRLQKELDEKKAGEPADETKGPADGTVLTSSWLKATTAQVKVALASVLKLRTIDAEDVRRELEKLCIVLLDECHTSLANARSMLVESAITLSNTEETTTRSWTDADSPFATLGIGTTLLDLASIYPELKDDIKSAVYSWVTSMSRIMQYSEPKQKQQNVQNIMRGVELCHRLQIDSSTLQESFASALRDSATALILSTKSSATVDEVAADGHASMALQLASTNRSSEGFESALVRHVAQRDTWKDFATLIHRFGNTQQQVDLATEMLNFVQDAEGVEQISAFWLALELIKASFESTSEEDDFLDLTSARPSSANPDAALHDLFTFSAGILADHTDSTDVDWRLEAIALEATAFTASRMGQAFRPELIDVLYPIATFLGSPQPHLRDHAIVALNIIARSCEYTGVSSLIIDNADYMVNSVALRLNTVDISPASTQVLAMMLRLTGPRLIPYLDDVVAAIFAALENYHGYPVLVESLFVVLSELVEQGVKSNQLLVEASSPKKVEHRKRTQTADASSDLLTYLDKRAKRKRADLEAEDDIIEVHPKKPWKEDKTDGTMEEDAIDYEGDSKDEDVVTKTPIYILLTKVADLSQHYLTSLDAGLRKQLLDLISKVCPALAPNENAFLPLINNVWPVVITRLRDNEPYVTIAACKTLAAICASAGDFVSTRFKTEWTDGLDKWCSKMKENAKLAGQSRRPVPSPLPLDSTTKAAARDHILVPGLTALKSALVVPDRQLFETTSKLSSAGLGRFAQARQIWEAIVELLVAIVAHVRVDDQMYDQMLTLVSDLLPHKPDVREAFEVANADAVWLAGYQKGWNTLQAPSARLVALGTT